MGVWHKKAAGKLSKRLLIDTIGSMKHKHAIEAYKLQALKGTKQGQGAEKKQPEENEGGKPDKTADKSAAGSGSRSGQTSEGRIFRGSTINSIINEGGLLRTGFGHKRAAKLLLLLGKEQASQVLRHLLPDEIEKVTAEIAGIKRIEKSEAEKILEEFGALAGEIAATPHGGIEVARDTQESPDESSEGLYIGCGSERQEGTFWSGLIDDVRIYSRVVTP